MHGLESTQRIESNACVDRDLTGQVQMVRGYHPNHRVAASQWVIGEEQHWLTTRRHLNCAYGGALTG
ncbi:hypothetical protein D3C72_2217150 [compost metagenome]